MYYLFRYRKKVVFENLRNAFPDKSETERQQIAKRYYSHLCDLIFESIKGCTISKDEVLKRHWFINPEMLNAYHAQGKSVCIVGAHFGNWEWVALSLPQTTPFLTHGIFQTINHPFLDKVVKKSRERAGMRLISKKQLASTFEQMREQRITMGFIGDQSPPRSGRNHWMRFLNQDTVVASGFEHFAKLYDMPVIYLNVIKVRRGFYECVFYPMSDTPQNTPDGELIEAFMYRLEGLIREKPEHWLWSHRRWKLKRPSTETKSV